MHRIIIFKLLEHVFVARVCCAADVIGVLTFICLFNCILLLQKQCA